MCWASGNGVIPRFGLAVSGSVRFGLAGRGGAGPDSAGRGRARQGKGCDGSTEGLRAFPAAFIGGQGAAGRGSVWCGLAGQGPVEQGRARVTDGGTEGFGLPCHSHKGGCGTAVRGGARRGVARCGRARQGTARSGRGCRRQHWGLRLPLLLSLEGRSGTAWRGVAGPDRAMHGQTRRDTARADDLSTGGFGLLCWVPWNPDVARHGAAGLGHVRLGMAWHGRPNADDFSTEGASPPC